MMCQTRIFVLLFLVSYLGVHRVHGGNIPLPLGIVFGQGTPEVQTAFKHALLTLTLNITTNPRDMYRFTAYVDTINTADAFKLSKLICNQFSRGIYAMVGSMNVESFHTYHAFANTFHMPLITPWYPTREVQNQQVKAKVKGQDLHPQDYATRLRPDFTPAVLETINFYGWKEVIYLYSGNEGLLRLQTLFYRQPLKGPLVKVRLVKKISSAKEAIQVLREVEGAERFSNKYVLLDTPTPLAKEILVSHVKDVFLGRRNYHYLLTQLAFDDGWEREVEEYGALNITGFRIVDTGRRYVQEFLEKWKGLEAGQFPGAGKDSISANAAFMFDAMLIIKEAFTDILTDNPFAFSRYSAESACDSGSDFLDDVRPFEYGQLVNQHLRRVQIEGLTGNIQFHENGTRKYFTVDVVEMRDNVTKVKIAQWSDYSGFRIIGNNNYGEESFIHEHSSSEKKIYTVTTILEEPYLTLKTPTERERMTGNTKSSPGGGGNDIYEGFIKDLADLLFYRLGVKYRLQLVKDGKYGNKVVTPFGGESWNGIVGELIRNEADLALGPLTITQERERVIQFTKPFLTQGISILAYKPKKNLPGMFSFMNPLSQWVWLSVLFSYLGVSAAFYVIYRLTTAHHTGDPKGQGSSSSNVEIVETSSTHKNNGDLKGQMYLIQKKRKKVDDTKLPVSSFLWMTFSILTSARGTWSIAGKFASTVWWLFAILLVSLYTGNYIAIRMKNKSVGGLRSVWDLVDSSGGIQYGIMEGGSTHEFFQKSENQVYRAMHDHMSGPTSMNLPSYEDGISTVRQKKGKYVFLMESVMIDYTSNKPPCNTMKIGYDLGEVQYGIGLPIGSPLTDKLNLELLKMREEGLIRKLEEKWWASKQECQIVSKLDQLYSSPSEDELSLGSMSGIFYILIIGMLVGIFVSFLEFFCKRGEITSGGSSSSGNNGGLHLQQGGSASACHHHGHHHGHHHHHSVHQNTVIDSVPMPTDFCDISADMK